MKIEVIIPAAGDPKNLIWSLGRQSLWPDMVTIISNEWKPPERFWGEFPMRLLRFSSDEYPYGYKDVALRRNIGIWESDADVIIFQDDDQVAPLDMIRDFKHLLSEREIVWGHHRFIDFDLSPEPSPVWWLHGLSPEKGRSREHGVNQEHLYQSGYAGCMGVYREAILAAGGFDMMFLGRHGSEDQSLARRMCGEKIFIHEPPFSWHPLKSPKRHPGPTNVCDDHHWEPDVYNGVIFNRCTRCPLWKFADRQELLFRDEVVVPYEHQLVHVVQEDL
jgi:hypothetical protein